MRDIAAERRARWEEKAKAILADLMVPRHGKEAITWRLHYEDWERIWREGSEYVEEQLAQRHWRGASGGVLPGGIGTDDIIEDVCERMLRGEAHLAMGWTWERLFAEFKRLVRDRVRRLNDLTEARELRNEWDLARVADDEEAVSVLECVPDPHQWREAEEDEEERLERRRIFIDYLRDEPELVAVFGCMTQGTVGTAEMAEALGMSEGEVRTAKLRLRRRIQRYRKENGKEDQK